MKHVSKIDGKEYEISESVSFENGKLERDDITLIWKMKPYEEKTQIVGFYYGGYDFDITESYIKDFIKYTGD